MQNWPQFLIFSYIHTLCNTTWTPLPSSGKAWFPVPWMWPSDWRWLREYNGSDSAVILNRGLMRCFAHFPLEPNHWLRQEPRLTFWGIKLLMERAQLRPSMSNLQSAELIDTQLLAGSQIRQAKTRTTLLIHILKRNNNVCFRPLSLVWFVTQQLITHINITMETFKYNISFL